MAAVRDGRAELAMLPCENSLAGRVPDIHRLLPDSGLHVVGEHFERVEHCLLAPRGATLATIRRARSHPVALGQVLRLLEELRLQPVIEADTAGAAALIAERGGVEDAELYEVFNMGCGFCVVVPRGDSEAAVEMLARRHPGAAVIGRTTTAAGVVELPKQGLIGRRGEGFTTSS